MKGFQEYGVIKNSKSEKILAKIGIQVSTYYNSSYMSDLISYNPDRVYILLGINILERKVTPTLYDHMVGYYKKIVDKCLKKNKDMEIIIMAVTPTTQGSSVSLAARNSFNSKLEKMYKDNYKSNPNICYWDAQSLLADKNGYLEKKNSAGDGIHWPISTYRMMYKEFGKYATEW